MNRRSIIFQSVALDKIFKAILSFFFIFYLLIAKAAEISAKISAFILGVLIGSIVYLVTFRSRKSKGFKRLVIEIMEIILIPFRAIRKFVWWLIVTIWNFLTKLKFTHKFKGFVEFKIGAFADETWFGESKIAQDNRVFIYFVAPALISFSTFVALPFFQGIFFSLTDWTGLNTGNEVFVGLENYSTIFTDYEFVYSFIRTAIYSILNIIAINLVAFGLALLVIQKLRFKNVYRAAFFMPNLIGGLVLGYIWQFVYNRAIVRIPDLFTSIGINEINIFGFKLFEFLRESLLVDGDKALFAIILVVSWQYAGYIMMIYIAALQNVPQDLIEASKIDGANAFQRLKAITLPMIAQAFTIAMFLTLTTSFKQFDTVVSLTQGGPPTQLPLWLANSFNLEFRPAIEALDFLAINIYDEAFVRFQMGIGQAKAIVFFVVLLIVSLVQVYFNKRKEVEL